MDELKFNYAENFNLGDKVSFPPSKATYEVVKVSADEVIVANVWGSVRVFTPEKSNALGQ